MLDGLNAPPMPAEQESRAQVDPEARHDVRGAAEITSIRERLVIAPCSGRFHPLPPDIFTTEGEWAREGQHLAEIRTDEGPVPVVSFSAGWVMGLLCVPGQPVAAGDPLLWIRT